MPWIRAREAAFAPLVRPDRRHQADVHLGGSGAQVALFGRPSPEVRRHGNVDLGEHRVARPLLDQVAALFEEWSRNPVFTKVDVAMAADFRRWAAKERDLSPRTTKMYISLMSAIWSHQRREGRFAGANPWHGLSPDQAPRELTGYVKFEIDELNTLFADELYRRPWQELQGIQAALRWLPVLALFSGARLAEPAQLRTSDVVM